jgi:chemotaxis protein histidine kinase CheA
MKLVARRGTRWLLLVVLAFSLIVSSGCGPKPISRETLDYFYGLVNQQYWQAKANGLALNDEYGTEQLVVAPTGTSDNQQYLVFGDVAVTSSSQKSGPTDAVIKIKVFDGTSEKEVRARVDDANLATLQKGLAETFESKTQRDQRLKGDEYAAKLKEADALLTVNKVADAIAAFKAAQAVDDTDEVKTRLDGIYLKQGKYYYGQKKYDIALARLKLVSFDPASLTEVLGLLPMIQADAAKAAAEKAAAKAAADKAAADKAAAKAAADKAAADKAAADKAAAKAAADKAAAQKAQRSTWYRALNSYYGAFQQAETAVFANAKVANYDDFISIVGRIQTYCNDNVGMEPTQLDQMRAELNSLVVTSRDWVNEIIDNGVFSTRALELMSERNRHGTEVVRLRDLLAVEYGH